MPIFLLYRFRLVKNVYLFFLKFYLCVCVACVHWCGCAHVCMQGVWEDVWVHTRSQRLTSVSSSTTLWLIYLFIFRQRLWQNPAAHWLPRLAGQWASPLNMLCWAYKELVATFSFLWFFFFCPPLFLLSFPPSPTFLSLPPLLCFKGKT